MQIRLKTDRVVSSPNSFGRELQRSGLVIEVDDREGYALLASGQAESLTTESAALAAPQRARPPRPKG